MEISQQLLDNLTAQAKASPRLRMNYDLRTSSADSSQRMLNALEPGTVLPIHRHRETTEVVVMLRGCGVQWLYDEEGNITGKVVLGDGGVPAMVVEKGQWHRLECMKSGSVLFEAKDGAYEPIVAEDVLPLRDEYRSGLQRRIKDLQEMEARSGSMPADLMTPLYVQRLLGGGIPLWDIEEAMGLM